MNTKYNYQCTQFIFSVMLQYVSELTGSSGFPFCLCMWNEGIDICIAVCITKLVLPELGRVFSLYFTVMDDRENYTWWDKAQSESFFWSQSTIYRSLKMTLQKPIFFHLCLHVLIFFFWVSHFPSLMASSGCHLNHIWKQLKSKQLGMSVKCLLGWIIWDWNIHPKLGHSQSESPP